MYPVGSNGASQAILDARALADRLAAAEHPFAALWAYEQERLPMTAQIVRMNRNRRAGRRHRCGRGAGADGFTDIDTCCPTSSAWDRARYASTAGFAASRSTRLAKAA